MGNLAPIIIFCYRRRIEKLINSLKENKEYINSDLYIFSDGYKSSLDKEQVLDVQKNLDCISGFKSITIEKSKHNKGLANSIIYGTTKVLKNYGKAIVLEDDLILSRHFLNFMNKSLSLFKEKKEIWSICGFGPDLPCFKDYSRELYLSLRPYSSGWATWIDRWSKIDWSMNTFHDLKNDRKKIKKFELGGNDLYQMLELQYLRKIDSWAIRWCYSQFLNSSFSVMPVTSHVKNIGGFDGYGTHDKHRNSRFLVKLANMRVKNYNIIYDYKIIDCFKKYHDITIYTRIGYLLNKYGGYKLVKSILRLFKST